MVHSKPAPTSRKTIALLVLIAVVVFSVSLYTAWSARSSGLRRRPPATGEASTHEAHPDVHDVHIASPSAPDGALSIATGGGVAPHKKRSMPDGGLEDVDPLQVKPAWVGVVDPPADMYDNTTPKIAIPTGGFDKWTGREGAHPGEVEMYARSEGTPIDLALELRRLHWLTSLSMNFNLLMELRGGRPPGEALEIDLAQLRDRTWTQGDQTYEAVRSGNRKADDARDEIRGLQEEYRKAYTAKAGITLEQMDQFYAPGIPLP